MSMHKNDSEYRRMVELHEYSTPQLIGIIQSRYERDTGRTATSDEVIRESLISLVIESDSTR